MITLACLCALCISSCVTFAAEDEFTVYVGGEEMTVSKDGTAATYNSPSGGEAKLWYDAEVGLKLEITDLKLDNEGIRTDHQMTLVIKGENSFDVGGSGPKLYGVYAKGGIVVSDESDGSLSVTVGDASMTSFGIYSAGDIVINGGELDVRAGKTDNQESIGIYAGKMVKINGGVVKAYGGNAVKDISSGIGAYDGKEDSPEEWELKLSDSYKEKCGKIAVEAVVKVYNVNYDKGAKLLEKCKTLQEYSMFMHMVRTNFIEIGELEIAVKESIRECIENNILAEYLMEQRGNIMSVLEVNLTLEERDAIREQDGYARGLEAGEVKSKRETAIKMKEKGFDYKTISELTGLTEEEIESL